MVTVKDVVLAALAQFEANTWYPPLSQAAEGLTAAEAKWRPAPAEHCVWDHVNHVAVWNEELASRLAGNPRRRELYESDGAGWPEPDGQGLEADWQASLVRLSLSHARLTAVVQGLDEAAITDPGGAADPAGKVIGLVAHEAYHGSQIILLRRLLGKWTPAG